MITDTHTRSNTDMKGTHVLGAKEPLLGLRIAQLVLAVVILGLSSYGVYWIVFDGDALTLSSAAISIIICLYVIIASTGARSMYNYWAILGLDILAVLLWIVSFPIMASQIANSTVYYAAYDYDYSDYYSDIYYKRGLGVEKRAETTWATYKSIMIATAALAGLEFVLFLITLIILSIQLHRHRKNGGHCMPGSAAPRHHHQEVETKPQRNVVIAEEHHHQPEVYHPPVSHSH